ncbi:ornithine carbamoyltransferase [Candidatus Vidania fulgoroideorum]
MNYTKFSNFSFDNYIKIYNYCDKIKNNKKKNIFKNKKMVMLFLKPSTRTRVTFEIGFKEEEGKVTFLSFRDTQLSRNETIEETIRILDMFYDVIVIRGYKQREIEIESKNPIINALTDKYHPCQIASDIYTLMKESKNYNLENKKILWVGEKNNLFNTWLEASKIFKFNLEALLPKNQKIKNIKNYYNFKQINKKYLAIATDTWKSMGERKKKKFKDFKNVTVNSKNLKKTKFFLHCMPAYIGKEVGDGVINNKKSLVWKAIENKKHVQKGIIYFLFKLLGRA